MSRPSTFKYRVPIFSVVIMEVITQQFSNVLCLYPVTEDLGHGESPSCAAFQKNIYSIWIVKSGSYGNEPSMMS